MTKSYWLEWARMDDFSKYPGLPGGFTSVKDARLCAVANAKKDHPININNGETIVKIGNSGYVLKSVKINNKYQIVKVRVLKDGTLTKQKPTEKDIVKQSEMRILNY